MVSIFTTIYILDPLKTKNGFETEEDALKYIYSNACGKCQESIKEKDLNCILETPCCFGFCWIEDEDDI